MIAAFTSAGAHAGTEVPIPFSRFTLVPLSGPTVAYDWALDACGAGASPLEGRMLSGGTATRALSDYSGQYEVPTLSIDVSDADKAISALLADATRRYFTGRELALYLTELAQLRAGRDPLIVARGVVRSHSGSPGRRFSFVAEDAVTGEFGPLRGDVRIPRRLIEASRFADAPAPYLNQPEPIIYGALSSGAGTVGAVICIPVGTVEAGGATWYRFMVQGAASKAIVELYQDGAPIDPGSYGVTFLCPGKAGWGGYFAAPYSDVGGRRYTFVYARGPAGYAAFNGTSPVTADVQGIEDAGDGSGALITHGPLQFLHWFKNFGAGDWQTGPWLAMPASSFGGVALGDAASFAAVDADASARYGAAWECAGALGANGERAPLRDWIARWAASCDCDVSFTPGGSLYVTTDRRVAAIADVGEADVVEGTFATPRPVWERHWNAIPVSYARDFCSGAWGAAGREIYSQDSIDAYGGRKVAPTTELWMVRAQALADKIGQLRLGRTMHPPNRVPLAVGFWGLPWVPGSILRVTHRDGSGAGGWVSRNVRVDRQTVDLTALTVSFDAVDVDGQSEAPEYGVVPGSTPSGGGYSVPGGGGTTPGVSGVPLAPIALGGSTRDPLRQEAGPAYAEIHNATRFKLGTTAQQGMTASMTVYVRSRAPGVTVRVRLHDEDGNPIGPESDAVDSRALAPVEVAVPMPASTKHVHLRYVPGAVDEDVWVAPSVLVLSY